MNDTMLRKLLRSGSKICKWDPRESGRPEGLKLQVRRDSDVSQKNKVCNRYTILHHVALDGRGGPSPAFSNCMPVRPSRLFFASYCAIKSSYAANRSSTVLGSSLTLTSSSCVSFS